jgi:CRP-like cAMP-binding protein
MSDPPQTEPGGSGSTLIHVASTEHRRAEALDATVWGEHFAWTDLQIIARFMGTFSVSSGHKVFRTHDLSSFLCLVIEGAMRIEKPDSDGVLKPIRTLASGSAFGEIAIIDEARRTADVTATEESLLLVLTKPDFEALAQEHPKVALELTLRLARILTARLRQASGMLVEYL